MPFTVGQSRPINSGRRPGKPNRKTEDIAARLEALGCDPITGMAKISMDETNPPELRLRAFAELAGYVHAKRKAVELSAEGAGAQPLEIIVTRVGSRRPEEYQDGFTASNGFNNGG